VSSNAVRLSDLKTGVIARFHEARLDADACRMLQALGLIGSSQIRLCQAGEPCIVEVRHTRIGLSKAVAGGIYVIPLSHHRA
jgi:Fe2+ transport system protein FeoA